MGATERTPTPFGYAAYLDASALIVPMILKPGIRTLGHRSQWYISNNGNGTGIFSNTNVERVIIAKSSKGGEKKRRRAGEE
jgi:hypothetical protein